MPDIIRLLVAVDTISANCRKTRHVVRCVVARWIQEKLTRIYKALNMRFHIACDLCNNGDGYGISELLICPSIRYRNKSTFTASHVEPH